MFCPDCKTENVSDAKFCRQCGRPIDATDQVGERLSWLALGLSLAACVHSLLFHITYTAYHVLRIGSAPFLRLTYPAAALASMLLIVRAGCAPPGLRSPHRRTGLAVFILSVASTASLVFLRGPGW